MSRALWSGGPGLSSGSTSYLIYDLVRLSVFPEFPFPHL